MEPRIIEDGPEVAVRKLSCEDACFLNRQTAGNVELVAGARECGCFHCGHRFAPAEVTSWIEGDEPYGGRTALCPCCGADAVIVGTEEPPLVLSTALLASLYLWWFKAEYEERLKRVTYAPSWFTRDDYLRHGVPFQLRDDARVERLGSIDLFPVYLSTPWEDPNAARGMLILIMAVVMLGMSYQMPVSFGIMQGAGDATFIMKVNMVSTWLIVLPLSFAAAFWWELPVPAVVAIVQSDQVFKCLPVFLHFRSYTWMKKLTREE